jgi:sarcosine oxidase subunit beta
MLNQEKDIDKFKQNVTLQNKLGIDTKWLSGDEIREWLNLMYLDDILAGTFNPNDGIVDPNSVVMGYISAASRLGVKAITDVEVTKIIKNKSKISGVSTTRGDITTQTIVNAAGPWAGLIGKMAGVEIPITPIRRQILTTTPISKLPDDFPFVIDFAQSLYFHKEGDGILTGMSNQNETPGFDQSVDAEWELTHMEAAINRLPLLENVGLISHWAGLYEVTPDAHPIIGKTPIKGFYLCTGFSGHGFMHGPIAGKLISEIILDGEAKTLDISMLDLERFSEGRTIQEYNVV